MKIELRKNILPVPGGNADAEFMPYLNTFLLDGAKTPLGAVLVLPGGGYTGRARHESDCIARKFNALGFHAFVLEYRVAPYIAPAPQEDVMRAIRIIRANSEAWGVGKLAVLGFSAGGHLAACAGVLYDQITEKCGDEADDFSARPDALVLCYAVTAMTTDFANAKCADNLTGSGTDAEKAKYDLHTKITPDTPPAFIWHTADDGSVPIKNALAFAGNMWKCGNTCELHVFPHGQHGLALGNGHSDIAQWTKLAATFLSDTVGFVQA